MNGEGSGMQDREMIARLTSALDAGFTPAVPLGVIAFSTGSICFGGDRNTRSLGGAWPDEGVEEGFDGGLEDAELARWLPLCSAGCVVLRRMASSLAVSY